MASYSLSECHEKYDSLSKDNRNWDKFHINRVGFKVAMESLMNVMYDEENKKLLPFAYPF